MVSFLIVLFLAMLFLVLFSLSIGFRLTGALLAAVFWSVIEIPLAIAAMLLGLALCCTIILIPIGVGCLKTGVKLLVPGM